MSDEVEGVLNLGSSYTMIPKTFSCCGEVELKIGYVLDKKDDIGISIFLICPECRKTMNIIDNLNQFHYLDGYKYPKDFEPRKDGEMITYNMRYLQRRWENECDMRM